MPIAASRSKLVSRGEPFEINWNGAPINAYPGETVLGALLAAGVAELGRSDRGNHPRLMFCGAGYCFDCQVEVDGSPHQRACVILATPGMQVRPMQRIEQVS